MAAEPTDPSLDASPSQGPWAPGGDPWSQSNNGTGNGTSGADGDQPFFHLDNIISLLTVLVSLCGAAGNGAVVWLLRLLLRSRFSSPLLYVLGLGFRRKRRRFSFHILDLAFLDCAFLLSSGILYTVLLLRPELEVLGNFWFLSQLLRLGLLVAVSTERCVSGPGPLRHPWPCLNRFSLVTFLLICALAVCLVLSELVCDKVDAPCEGLGWAHVVTVVVTLLVLCVSSLTLLVRVQCGSRRTRPSRLDVTVLLTVLAFLLLGLPYTVHVLALTIASDTGYVPGLWETLGLLSTINSAVNPVIYFLVGRYRQRPGKMPLREVLQRALSDNSEGMSGWAPTSPQTLFSLLSPGERAALSELNRRPSRAAAQEARSLSVSPHGPCEEEATPVLTH